MIDQFNVTKYDPWRGLITYWYHRHVMADLKTIQQQLEAFVKMYKEDKELSDRRMQELTTRVKEFSMTRTPERSNARSNESNSYQPADHSKAGNNNSSTDNTQLFVLNLIWSFRTLMARKTHYHGSHRVTIFSPMKTLHIARSFWDCVATDRRYPGRSFSNKLLHFWPTIQEYKVGDLSKLR